MNLEKKRRIKKPVLSIAIFQVSVILAFVFYTLYFNPTGWVYMFLFGPLFYPYGNISRKEQSVFYMLIILLFIAPLITIFYISDYMIIDPLMSLPIYPKYHNFINLYFGFLAIGYVFMYHHIVVSNPKMPVFFEIWWHRRIFKEEKIRFLELGLLVAYMIPMFGFFWCALDDGIFFRTQLISMISVTILFNLFQTKKKIWIRLIVIIVRTTLILLLTVCGVFVYERFGIQYYVGGYAIYFPKKWSFIEFGPPTIALFLSVMFIIYLFLKIPLESDNFTIHKPRKKKQSPTICPECSFNLREAIAKLSSKELKFFCPSCGKELFMHQFMEVPEDALINQHQLAINSLEKMKQENLPLQTPQNEPKAGD